MSLGLYTNYALNNYNQSNINTKTDASKSVTESNSTSKTTSNSVDEYYKGLCAKFPNLNIIVGHFSKGAMIPTSANIDHAPITIDPAYLKKAANDPKVAAELEKNLGDEPMALNWLKNAAKMDGNKVTSLGSYYDANGDMCSAGGIATDNSSSKSSTSLMTQFDELLEKRLKRLKEQRKAENRMLSQVAEEDIKKASLQKQAAKSYNSNLFNKLNVNLLDLNS
ncbi:MULTISPECIES: DUF6033 family protein [Clostridium]|uniref:Uncharacterized protein n=3 Tax=Clostridium TaxID=1485 RepID=D8GTQ0_CLOLD|nr:MULTISPECIES: DUF6033 family protein [Clostridium]ADK14699.1 hypothetical protein CLJU_c16350 [Clostridium ljungdahlii DSM 13528]AGY77932.1 DUF6033 family protein [Clostridium autoethanogenum DSM 10061]ALU38065.1 hypothetical protein CLAU_3638 [Clostridium autoethanogenum DSM 10061]OAA85936.1 hypothetical protein WX45_00141 [Clostridium ljungdahlii DSM 13528]OVY50829.1 hypothetical protein WX72_01990 [Clostridium autoethanogenum]